MLRTDQQAESVLAFAEDGALVGVATLAADARRETAEVAVSVHRDWKAQGIGWSLLRHAAQIARATGISRLQSIESRENHAAIEVERTEERRVGKACGRKCRTRGAAVH